MRHTRPVLSKAYCYGKSDIAVADTFESDADDAMANLPTFDRIVSSPLIRTRRLADRIAQARKLDVTIDERIREMDFGRWEARLWSDIPRHELDAWAADFMDASPHGGEHVRAFQARCRTAVQEWAERDGDTLMVCHAGVVRAVFANGDRSEDFSKSLDYGQTLRWPD